jgi:hypothetical protein
MKVRLRSLDAPDSAMKLVLESKFPISGQIGTLGRLGWKTATNNSKTSCMKDLSIAPTRPRPFKSSFLFAPITVPFLFLAAAIFGQAHRQVWTHLSRNPTTQPKF